MKTFIGFLNESEINKIRLSKIINLYNEKIDLQVDYFLKEGSPVFTLALYLLLDKKGDLYECVDDEKSSIHSAVKFDSYYWDINGGSGLERKNEFITSVGTPRWVPVTKEKLYSNVQSKTEVVKTYQELKKLSDKIADSKL